MNTVPRIKPADIRSAQSLGQGNVPGMDPLEWETRVDLAACYRLVDLYGMCDLHQPSQRGCRARTSISCRSVRHDVRGDHRLLAD